MALIANLVMLPMLIEKFRARLEKLTVPEEVMKTINEELVCFQQFFFFFCKLIFDLCLLLNERRNYRRQSQRQQSLQ